MSQDLPANRLLAQKRSNKASLHPFLNAKVIPLPIAHSPDQPRLIHEDTHPTAKTPTPVPPQRNLPLIQAYTFRPLRGISRDKSLLITLGNTFFSQKRIIVIPTNPVDSPWLNGGEKDNPLTSSNPPSIPLFFRYNSVFFLFAETIKLVPW